MSTPARVPVLHLINTLEVGGAERQLITLLEAFDRERFEHHVGVLSWGGFLAGEVQNDPSLRFVDFRFRHRAFLPSLARVVRYQREHGIRVVHAHLHLVGIYARIAARLARTPVVVYTEHSDVADRSRFECLVEQVLAPWTSMKITVSEEQRRLTQQREGFPADRVITMSNSVPCGRFAPDVEMRARSRTGLGLAEDDRVVGIVGRVEERKRVRQFLQACAQVSARCPRLRGLVVGDGPELGAAKRLAAELGLAERVVFAGRHQDVAPLFRAMDLLAITSRWEGLPINMLEAMASGLPVVATAVGAIPEVLLSSGAGEVVGVEDFGALCDAIANVLDDDALRAKRGRAAREYVLRHHDAALNCRRLEALYLDLLDQRGAGAELDPEGVRADSA